MAAQNSVSPVASPSAPKQSKNIFARILKHLAPEVEVEGKKTPSTLLGRVH